VEGQVSASMQNQPLAVLEWMDGVEALASEVLYGSGLRWIEALRLHVKDLDFERQELTAHDGKGGKNRRTMLPLGVGEQLRKLKRLHVQALADGYGPVQLPRTLSRKYRNADREWDWQWVFPSTSAGAMTKQGSGAGILSIRVWSKRRFAALFSRQRSAKPPRLTASDIHLPPIYLNVAMTFARFRK